MAPEIKTDKEIVEHTHNTARFFTEKRQVSWVLLAATLLWGAYGYFTMPKRKDPAIQIRLAVATCQWPGASAEKVEQLVTRKLEQKMAENSKVEKIESISRSSVSIVYVTLKEDLPDQSKEWDDIKGKLDTIRDLPQGAGPINFIKDFGDTTALMLSVASPKASSIELELRARSLEHAIESVRRQSSTTDRATLIVSFPPSINSTSLRRIAGEAAAQIGSDGRVIEGPGFVGIDLSTHEDDQTLLQRLRDFAGGRMALSELHPDVWQPVVIRNPAQTLERISLSPGERYSYRELDDFTDTIQRYLQSVPQVAKVARTGVLPEQISLEYSQERLASYGIQPNQLGDILGARNITAPGGVVEVGGKNVIIDPSGEFHSEADIGGVSVGAAPGGTPLYLRDLVDVSREYQNPPRFLNFLVTRDADGTLRRNRCITLSVNMRDREQIAAFGDAVQKQLEVARASLPSDLIIRRTSDQPLQVKEAIDLFMNSLYEAIILVVIVALLGFWDWRTALLLALCIPITLAMTFGLMQLFGIDVQQISIASLILALGLLVDDPVVAGDAIKRSLGEGWKPLVAAWLGPTKLATAILFATITNIAAYLPLLTVAGDTGKFIYSLPVVLTLSLVASRIVSMTFVPLLGSALLRAPKKAEPTSEERRSKGFAKYYSQVAGWAIDHRRLVATLALGLLLLGVFAAKHVRTSFFPKDVQYLSYVEVWLPEDAPLSATRMKVAEATSVIKEVLEKYGEDHKHGVFDSVTEFVGAGGPRFWFSVSPEQQQLNYAQLVIQVKDKEDTPALIPLMQEALTTRITGARIDVRELETGKPVGVPIAVRVSGDDMAEVRALAERVKSVFNKLPNAERVRDDWGADTFAVRLQVDPDRANLAGVTNLDVAASSATAMNGRAVGSLRENQRQIPIVARLRADERARLDDIRNLYVNSLQTSTRVPLGQVSRISYGLQTEKIRRRNQFRTITVGAFPRPGVLASTVMAEARADIDKIASEAPPGYSVVIGGEKEEQVKGFTQLAIALAISVFGIFIALVLQFNSAIKPLIVFAALPFGAMGAMVSLLVMGAPFSFMAFLGIISLMGVIVSHIIVLFDFIEEMHHHGEPLRDALIDAGIVRLRPVLITVGATVLGLVPLAFHGGPLWQPLCYAQIGGLTIATFLTLLLVPVLYTIVVRDLKWIAWER